MTEIDNLFPVSDNGLTDHSRFTTGDCHILALELHRQSNREWKLAISGVPHCRHAFVIKENEALDVTGVSDVKTLTINWGEYPPLIVDESYMQNDWSPSYENEVFANSKIVARKLAYKLLQETT
jgi:hypothetical protein